MEAVFIRELGIHPWDQLHPSNDENYITVTLLHQDYAGAWKAWCEFSSLLTKKWPNIVQWHTKLLPYYSKTQEYLSLKNFAKSSQPGDIFRKNESTGIYSRVIHLDPDPFHIDPNSMACYRTSVTLMQESNSTLENLWQNLSQLTDISKTEDFKLILADEHSISFRFYDAETHGVAQLICHSEHLPFLNETIKKMNLEEIQQEGVYAYIHS
ncbi:hypothetical protein [Pseudomonas fluorescens]|uniref:hypothetical protein n=1 Tax=Pseudomonas fluorescens TaxID=294 RepID=UPI0012562A0F|nr:hypothetical protein [Pseudomonas fluorescens]VVO43811.1 hypothetical protein PS720_06236 [Pseudomonas fluorescens]